MISSITRDREGERENRKKEERERERIEKKRRKSERKREYLDTSLIIFFALMESLSDVN